MKLWLVWPVLVAVLLLSVPVQAQAALSAEDLAWLDRVTYGVNKQTAEEYEKLGREKFLEKQLHPPAKDVLDDATEGNLARNTVDMQKVMEDVTVRRQKFVREVKDQRKRSEFNTLIRREGNKVLAVSKRRHLIRAIYSPWQLKEQMAWFWQNHFSVFSSKAYIRFQVGDYEDKALRPHALGKFKDILLATMTHPAMLDYLDASKNKKGKPNENYARELMELHTMGVGSGYTQKDITEVARVLTGISVNFSPNLPKLNDQAKKGFFRKNGVQFMPRQHDFGDKIVLGKTIKGQGWDELAELADLLARQPATAKHISTKLAQYFVGDKPDPALIKSMSERFMKSDGDISQTLATLFESKAFQASLGSKFRTPMEVVVSTARLAYEDRQLQNYVPLTNSLDRLGQGLYKRVTPDGYPMQKSMWDGSSQLFQRFEAVRFLSSGAARFFQYGKPSDEIKGSVPDLNNAFFEQNIKPHLSETTLAVLNKTPKNKVLWNSMLFSSPEWMNREYKK
ncbi:DUF1800 domain-containing protein [Advenella mimigardefordensis]|uniref:DUF1800 domain-containing protein n=1 Tax=Advenella mimigardefordensis TaxID=302406 RepID=UPI0004B98331|nr:DUF1800 domain-containing protein [Advenella mimigardefordensis]